MAIHSQSLGAAFAFEKIVSDLNIIPDIKLTINPSFNDEKDFIGVYSAVRIRYAL